MTAIHIPTAARIRQQRDYMRRVLNELTDPVLDELHRRAEHPESDAYPASVRGAGVTTSDIPRPTEIAALAANTAGPDDPDQWAEPEPDLVLEMLAELFAELAEATGHLRKVERRAAAVLATADAHRGRESSLAGDCRACGRPVSGAVGDKLRERYCNACYTAWLRLKHKILDAGQPFDQALEHQRFEQDRPQWSPSGERHTDVA